MSHAKSLIRGFRRRSFLRRYDFMIKAEVTEDGSLTGACIYRFLDRRPEYLPRIGEKLFVSLGLKLTVIDVIHNGLGQESTQLLLEPITLQQAQQILMANNGNKSKPVWIIDPGKRAPTSIPEDFD